MRNELITQLRQGYNPFRVHKVEPEFLEFEEEMASEEDLKKLLVAKGRYPNPHNSTLLYVLGLTDEYNPTLNVDTIGGASADIDLDFDTQDYSKVIDWVVEHWGREQVANIITLQKFKPRSTVNKFFAATMPENPADIAAHTKLRNEILAKIPDARYGKEPTLKEIIEGNKKKGYKPHPELATDEEYQPWYETAQRLEDMVSTFSIHACGLVISNNPISDVVPVWFKKTKDEYSDLREVGRWITQFPMEEIEKLGMLKCDFLRIENLSIIKETIKLIEQRHGIKIDPYKIDPEAKKPYELFHKGLIAGIFQFEASKMTKDYAMKMRPETLGELSDVSALVRPGPLDAGLPEEYIRNKRNGFPSEGVPPKVSALLDKTYWVLTYQEQLMNIVSTIAGFSLKDADDVRKAMGKKKVKVLEPFREQFIKGCIADGLEEDFATHYWDDVLIGYAEYAFNLSHSIAYAYLSYLCAWFKTYYPIEFFTSLMSVRSTTLQPDKWAAKAPDYIREAQEFGITVRFPDINKSVAGFRIIDNTIYFGFSAIKQVGAAAANAVINARGDRPFSSIKDFLDRVDKSKLNTGAFEQLIMAGVFDNLGYQRTQLFDQAKSFYEYYKIVQEFKAREIDNVMREQENIEIQKNIELRDRLRKKAKKEDLTIEEQQFLEDNKRILLKRPLKLPDIPKEPELPRHTRLSISVPELITQGELLGCWINHPAGIVYPHTTRISDISDVAIYEIAGTVQDLKTYKSSSGNRTVLFISDGTGSLRLTVYDSVKRIPKKGELICAKVKGGYPDSYYDADTDSIKVSKIFNLAIYGDN